MKNAAFGCQACIDPDCDITHLVAVPTHLMIDDEMLVNERCIDEARRTLEASPWVAGPVQIVPMTYGGAA
jgi:hypothetical protein